MPDDEHEVRAAVAECAARLWTRRLASGTSGNVSAKLAGGDVIATPSRRSLANLRAADLVRVAPDGTERDSRQRATSELPLHLAAYNSRAEIRCVVHSHPTFCVVWSACGGVFPADTVGARETLGPVAWTPYRPPGSEELAAICAAEFARGFDTVLMERHGLTAIAKNLEDAFDLTDLAEEAARVGYFTRIAKSGDIFAR